MDEHIYWMCTTQPNVFYATRLTGILQADYFSTILLNSPDFAFLRH